ncbi:putative docking protein 3 [Penaeus vannamei]|uniref:Putative docking protein 3 n=1 Tax=Penaeus vannamei TaxID=6689 RepID=A0A3R7N394_PENVA|nr:putative docking protein 3 [Penaeus vannamei]
MVTVGAETRSKLAVDGQIRMLIEEGHITLISPEGKRVMRWSMGQLRRFGYKINNFHLEAGRKSESGEGVFSFVTNQGRQIHAMVTKEKARTRTSGLSLTPSLPVGQVTPPEPSDAPVITIGGHTYEEVEVMQNKDLLPALPQASPTKPPRPSQNKFPNDSSSSAESLSAAPVPIAFANIKSRVPSSVSGGMDARQGMMPRPYPAAHGPLPDGRQKHLYSEPEIPTQAWRTHGTDVYDKTSECWGPGGSAEAVRASEALPSRPSLAAALQPPNKPLTEDHYANNHILADPASPAPRPPQFPQHIVVNQEATYAVVSKLRPKHRSGPSRTDKPDGVTSLQENSLI